MPKIEFDALNHKYYVDGLLTKSVTQIISEGGASYANYTDENAAHFGTTGHAAITVMIGGYHNYEDLPEFQEVIKVDDDGDEITVADSVDWFMTDDDCAPYVRGIEKFVEEQSPQALCLEEIVYSKSGYIGRLDFFGRINMFKNSLILLDWKFWNKSSKSVLATAGLQTAAYLNALVERDNIKGRPKRGVVHFFPDGYQVIELKNNSDRTSFVSAMNWERWKEQNL